MSDVNLTKKQYESLSKNGRFLYDCRDPFFFIEKMWGLVRQPCYPQYEKLVEVTDPTQWKAEWFGTCHKSTEIEGMEEWEWYDFRKGKHITWQQSAIVEGCRLSVMDYKNNPNKITVKTGNGIGKSCVASLLILWYIFTFKDAVIPCTAPSSAQMKDVLWGSIADWLGKMPKVYGGLFEITGEYLRTKAAPMSWFARARTARDEKPEAFSGVHAPAVLVVADESSGVSDVIFEYGQGIMTSDFWLFLMFSNPTRPVGYFCDSFSETSTWKQYTFDSRQSPVVNKGFLEEKLTRSGLDSDDFRVFVKGEFPKVDGMDKSGYVPLLTEEQLTNAFVQDLPVPFTTLGVDPAGEGNDKSAFVGRNRHVAKILGEESVSTPLSVASKGVTLAVNSGVKAEGVAVDIFGIGAKTAIEMGKMGFHASAINVGDKAEADFLNMRAQLFWYARQWITSGGQLVKDERWLELLKIKYRYNMMGKLQILGKTEMRKQGVKSPDFADAFALTFAVSDEASDPLEDDEAEEDGGDIYD